MGRRLCLATPDSFAGVGGIVRSLSSDGLLVEDPEQPWLDLEPSDALDQLNAASIRYRIAVGQGAGGRTLTLNNPALARTDSTPKPRRCCATP